MKSGVLSQRSISTLRKFDLRGSDFTAQWGRSVGAFCIFRGGARGERKNDVQRGGGCAKPLRGQAPVTPKRLLHSRFASATHYKTEIFVDGTRADAIDLPDMQIFKLDFDRTRPASAAHQNRGRNFPFRHLPVGPVSCPTPTLRNRILCVYTVFSPTKIPADICRQHLQTSCKRGQNGACSNYAECSRYSTLLNTE